MKKIHYNKRKVHVYFRAWKLHLKLYNLQISRLTKQDSRSQTDIYLPVRHRRNHPMGPMGRFDTPTVEDQGTKAIWAPQLA
jgi:hypothetical protein